VQTSLADFIKDTEDGKEADAILRKCVHCGFCNATCPTYQLLGDELDGPRGRIYLIKRVLEGEPASTSTQLHLDRCLTCRNCETTCPSGVQYGRLLDIGREVVEDQVGRGVGATLMRSALKIGVTSRAFAPAVRLGQAMRGLLPAALSAKVPVRRDAGVWPTRTHACNMLLLVGCVQPAMAPNIHAASARVLDALGIGLLTPARAGCCGAIRHHLDDPAGALDDARRNIDAWWPAIEAGATAIVINASGCGTQVKEYGHLLRDDPQYADKARRVASLARDIAEILAERADALNALAGPIANGPRRIVFHPPCSLQHGQRVRGVVESLLQSLGAEVLPFNESHLCCGSAGTYSLLQPQLANALRERKLTQLHAVGPQAILSANVGCISHLAGATETPVAHWIEWVDQRLRQAV
jgi:glycolate oxidase iron-sulfur subunit